MKRVGRIRGFFIIVALFAAGCSSVPTLGDQMLVQSANTRELGDKWNKGNRLLLAGEELQEDGQQLIEDGEDMIKKGKKLIEKGEEKIKKGQKSVSKGKEMAAKGAGMMEAIEKEFSETFPSKTLE